MPVSPLLTERLVLRGWLADDRPAFAALNADPEVMKHFPACLDRAESDALIDRIESHFEQHGYGLFAVERKGMSKELRNRAKQHLTDLQYKQLTGELRGKLSTMDRKEYSKQYAALNVQFLLANKIPSGYQAGRVLSTVIRHAKAEADADLFEKALDAYKAHYAGQSRYERMVEMYAKQLKELRK